MRRSKKALEIENRRLRFDLGFAEAGVGNLEARLVAMEARWQEVAEDRERLKKENRELLEEISQTTSGKLQRAELEIEKTRAERVDLRAQVGLLRESLVRRANAEMVLRDQVTELQALVDGYRHVGY